MKINCELPLCMMNENTNLNDIDFVLFHLYKSNDAYREYYKKMREEHPERTMIFDNSAYEFFVKGETLDMDAYVQAIIDLGPDYYILPDVLRDKQKTIDGVTQFMSKYVKSNIYKHYLLWERSKPMAVAQGSSSEDLVECIELFKKMKMRILCLPFHLSFYTEGEYDEDIVNTFKEVYGEITEDIRYAMGRIRWIRQHADLLGIGSKENPFDYIHCLGSHCPLEKKLMDGIDSTDTGYPVKCGIAGFELEKEPGKPTVIIDDFLDTDLPESTRELIRTNVNKFRYY